MGVIREEFVLADKFTNTFKSFDAAANASKRTATEFQEALNSFTSDFIDGLTESLDDARKSLEDIARETNDAASAQSALAGNASGAASKIRDAELAQGNFTNEIERSNTSAMSLIGTLGRVASAIGVAKLAKEFIETSDEMAQINAKLGQINDGTQTTAEFTTQIFESAQRARGSFSETANLVARLGMNAREAFSTNGELVTFAENLNKSFKIAGATSQEQASVMLQLTQALGSGILRGQEFNAVMAGAPNVMRTIADYMGVGVGQLRDMAAEGQITADIVKSALLGATEDINAQFEQMPATFSDIMTTTKNEVVKSLDDAMAEWIATLNSSDMRGAIDAITGALTTLAEVGGNALNLIAKGVITIRDNWDSIEPVLIAAGAAILTYKATSVAAALEVKTAWVAANSSITSFLKNGTAINALLGGGAFYLGQKTRQEYNKVNESIKSKLDQKAKLLGYDSAEELNAARKNPTVGASTSSSGRTFSGASGTFVTIESPVWNGQTSKIPQNAEWYAAMYGNQTSNRDIFKALEDENALLKMWQSEKKTNAIEQQRREDAAKALNEITSDGVKVKGEVRLADEDLKIFRDIAEGRYTANVELQTLAPNISVNVEGGADLTPEDIADAIAGVITEQMNARTALSY